MDEGFTSYASNLAMASIFQPNPAPQRSSYGGYYRLVKSGLEEPMSTHADHYQTNSAYSAAAYSKGAVFLAQLGYVIGEEARDRGMLRYWNTWKFKHPNVNDLVRVMEKESGLELDWYKEYFVNSTKTIDYAVKEVKASEEGTSITLERVGAMPMPVDLVITYKDGSKELIYLPLEMMRGDKKAESGAPALILSQDWAWTHPTKTIHIKKALDAIKSVEIDPSKRMADVQAENNKVEF
jgi:aminopeptidase N